MTSERKNFRLLLKQTLRHFVLHWMRLGVVSVVFIVLCFILGKMTPLPSSSSGSAVQFFLQKFFFLLARLRPLFFLFLFFLFVCAVVGEIKRQLEEPQPAGKGAYPGLSEIVRRYGFVQILYFLKVLAWSLAMIIPGIIFAVLYSAGGMAALVDNKAGDEALAFSRKLIRSNLNFYLDNLLFLAVSLSGVIWALVHISTYLIELTILKQIYLLTAFVGLLQYVILAYGAIFFLIFYYYLYLELKERTGSS